MDTRGRPSTLKLSASHPASPISSAPSSARRQSQSPFRYMQLEHHVEQLDEKSTPLADLQTNIHPLSPSGRQRGLSPSSPSRAGTGSQMRPTRSALPLPTPAHEGYGYRTLYAPGFQ
ncbi:hypothetical protein H0H87_001171 [Tephrocybe sp. NHM501043]|nr:hypothetical protein H0H87_001171 [Tephrocybe sp. NHM501043]